MFLIEAKMYYFKWLHIKGYSKRLPTPSLPPCFYFSEFLCRLSTWLDMKVVQTRLRFLPLSPSTLGGMGATTKTAPASYNSRGLLGSGVSQAPARDEAARHFDHNTVFIFTPKSQSLIIFKKSHVKGKSKEKHSERLHCRLTPPFIHSTAFAQTLHCARHCPACWRHKGDQTETPLSGSFHSRRWQM